MLYNILYNIQHESHVEFDRTVHAVFQSLKKQEHLLKNSKNTAQIKTLDTREERLYLEEYVCIFAAWALLGIFRSL